MPKQHGKREQKRLAKRKAKQNAKRQQLAERSSPNPAIRLKHADRWPVAATLIPDNLWSGGIGQLIIARRTPEGDLACGMVLLDVFCLGVKDAWWRVFAPGEFKEMRKQAEKHCRLEDAPPEYFAKLLYRAVDYAHSLGFPPHSGFRHVDRLLAGIDPSLCPDEWEFGQDGRPHYINGPTESIERVRSVANRVRSVGGEVTIVAGPGRLTGDLETLGMDDELERDDDEFALEDDFGEDEQAADEAGQAPGRRW